MNPRTGSRATTAAGVLRLLQSCCESSASAWDADPAVVGVGGDALDLRAGTMRPAVAADRLRRRLASAPADDDAYAASRWRGVIEHVIPDPHEREYLKRRLGLALMQDGSDDLLWIFGDSGSGKGVVLAALRAAFGSYAAAIPAAEVTAGAARGHSQWRARLRGCRLMLIDDAPPRDLDTGVINGLLGSVMSANAMRKGSVDFRVDAPLLVTANRLPRIRANDAGFRRRLKAIQAGESIPEDDRDPELRRAVTTPAEQASTVRWLCDGARAASVQHAPDHQGGDRGNRGGGLQYPPASARGLARLNATRRSRNLPSCSPPGKPSRLMISGVAGASTNQAGGGFPAAVPPSPIPSGMNTDGSQRRARRAFVSGSWVARVARVARFLHLADMTRLIAYVANGTT